MKLYGTPGSPFVSRVLLVAKLKSIDLPIEEAPAQEVILARLMDRLSVLQKDPSVKLPAMQIMAGTPFQKMNPLARIPTLEIDGRFLGESTTICEYLEERYPEPALLPKDLYDRARVRLLCRMCDLYIGPQGGTLMHHIDPLTRNAETLKETKEYLKISLWELEQVMGPGPWAYGSAVSLADCVMLFTLISLQNMLYVTTTENLGMTAFDPNQPFSENPKLAAWWAHLQRDEKIGPTMRSYVEDAQKVLSVFIPDGSPAAFGAFMRARAPRA